MPTSSSSCEKHADVEPFLAVGSSRDRESILVEIERSQSEPGAFGSFVLESDGRRAGVLGFEREYERSRIARLAGLALHPDFRGCGLADEAARRLGRHLVFDLGYHRLQLEIYGFNERAIRHAERVGYVREGVKRKAYRAQPPGDEVRVLDAAERGALATASYVWARAPETRAGELLLEPSGDQTKRLVVTLE